MGHQVKLMPAKYVKAFNIRNKSDAADARALWLAVQQPSKAVAVKTEAQRAVLALHRMRQQLVKFRTMQINNLRGLLTEYGEAMGQGRAALDNAMPGVLERVAERLPAVLIDTLREQWDGLTKLDQQIDEIERRLRRWTQQDNAVSQGTYRHSRRGSADSLGGHGDNGRSERIQIGARVRCMGRPRTQANGIGRQDHPARHQQAR